MKTLIIISLLLLQGCEDKSSNSTSSFEPQKINFSKVEYGSNSSPNGNGEPYIHFEWNLGVHMSDNSLRNSLVDHLYSIEILRCANSDCSNQSGIFNTGLWVEYQHIGCIHPGHPDKICSNPHYVPSQEAGFRFDENNFTNINNSGNNAFFKLKITWMLNNQLVPIEGDIVEVIHTQGSFVYNGS